jgi:mannan endo-1,4-beta-mannosidase
LVDYWVQPDVVTLIQKHQAYLLVNIGNEVGNYKVTPEQFMAGYTDAVNRMRTSGIHVPLVIDASDCGKNLDILDASAGMLIVADPDKNLVFSVHLYWPMLEGADAAFIQSKLQAAVALNYPLIIGEFSQYGAYTQDAHGNAQNICGPFGEIDYQTILNVADENEIGWYAWEWGPGNDQGQPPNPSCVVMDMTPDGQFNNLKPGWATDVVNSIRAASEKPGYFTLQPL